MVIGSLANVKLSVFCYGNAAGGGNIALASKGEGTLIYISGACIAVIAC